MNSESHQKITAGHLKRQAYLYVRQSTLRQVFENTESTKRQYALRERAVALGWPFENIVVIDSDLGRSGADSDREGFQKLVAAVGMGEVGVVLGLEVSRLARNNADWHRLLEICALTDTLILDEDGLYNPAHFNDRLLLGLKGTMSEAELHVLRARLLGGQRAKASRGELEMKLPIGFAYDSSKKVILDPDLQIQQAVRTFFDTFQRTSSATGTVRSFREQGLLFPRRISFGPNKGEVVWGPLHHSHTLRTLKNPRYTGAFVYGRHQVRKTATGTTYNRPLPRDQWHTLLLDSHPGYITWAQYEENLGRIRENAQANGADRRKSPPREGIALLQGLTICGRCGNRMTIRYHMGHGGLVPEYVCQRAGIERAEPICQRIVGADLDKAIGELLVETVRPLALEVALAVQDELDSRAEEADRLRRQQVERARYEAEAAQRRYLRVDPDNRLVADSLEADWNHKLRALASAQEEYERQSQAERFLLDDQKRKQILALATDFPKLWRDPATPQRERKRVVRLLIEDVTLLKSDEMAAHVRFRGGATRTLQMHLPLTAGQLRKVDPAVVAEVDRLLDEHNDAEIVDILNSRGFHPGVAERFSLRIVYILRRTYRLDDHRTRLRRRGLLTLSEIRELLKVDQSTIKKWALAGHIASRVYNDKGQRLFQRPAQLHLSCQWCGGPISAKPSLRRGRKWCSQRCCLAFHGSRKRAARIAAGNQDVA
ncbi:MAG TPA: recombinase family protein [Candidatus Baltobacterales bacterium]|nr:recombinase family protein [Candidatus Baltobacterales bacterium]